MLILGLDFGFLLSLAFQGVLVGFSLDSPNLRKLSIYGVFFFTYSIAWFRSNDKDGGRRGSSFIKRQGPKLDIGAWIGSFLFLLFLCLIISPLLGYYYYYSSSSSEGAREDLLEGGAGIEEDKNSTNKPNQTKHQPSKRKGQQHHHSQQPCASFFLARRGGAMGRSIKGSVGGWGICGDELEHQTRLSVY